MKKLHNILLGLNMLLILIAAGTIAEKSMLHIVGRIAEDGSDKSIMSITEIATQDLTRKKVSLTFDDGPNAKYTEKLLDGLKERGVHATFFLLGKQVENSPQIVKRMQEEGHLIGNHSYEHVNLSTLGDEAAIVQVDKTNEAIYKITGEYPEYIRPPFGCWKSNLDYETTMIEVLWNVDTLDT